MLASVHGIHVIAAHVQGARLCFCCCEESPRPVQQCMLARQCQAKGLRVLKLRRARLMKLVPLAASQAYRERFDESEQNEAYFCLHSSTVYAAEFCTKLKRRA